MVTFVGMPLGVIFYSFFVKSTAVAAGTVVGIGIGAATFGGICLIAAGAADLAAKVVGVAGDAAASVAGAAASTAERVARIRSASAEPVTA